MNGDFTFDAPLDDMLEYSPTEPRLVTALRWLDRGEVTEDDLTRQYSFSQTDAIEAIIYLEANGVDCKDATKGYRKDLH